MTVIPLAHRIKSADMGMLQEVLREAEIYLSAQLTAAIAADLRAYTFAGAISAAAVILIGASYSTASSAPANAHLAYTAFVVAVGLFLAAWLAVQSARSIEFAFAGNEPCKWVSDIEEGKLLPHALAEQCGHYDEMIEKNRKAMGENGDQFNCAVNIALSSVGVGGLSFLSWLSSVNLA